MTTHRSFIIPFEDEFEVIVIFVAEHDTEVDSFHAIFNRIWITLVHSHKAFIYDLFSPQLHSVVIIPYSRLELSLYDAAWARLEADSERRWAEVTRRRKSKYPFCQELVPEVAHDGGPCDCMSRVSRFI